MGAWARHALTTWLSREGAFLPWHTLLINVSGSLLLGLLVGWLQMARLALPVRLGLTVGLCGGFTTFSLLAYESVMLLRIGHLLAPLTYLSLTLTLGPLAMLAGLWLSGALPPADERAP